MIFLSFFVPAKKINIYILHSSFSKITIYYIVWIQGTKVLPFALHEQLMNFLHDLFEQLCVAP